MSDKAEKPEKKAEAAAGAEKPRGGGLMSKTPVLLAGAMVLEAIVLFAGFKFLGGGAKPANGATLASPETKGEGGDKGEGADKGASKGDKKTVEIKVLDFKAENRQSGRTFLYDVSIYVAAKGAFEEKVNSKIKENDALIQDRVRTIIAQSDPEKLGGSEPGLETLRRQIKYQLDEIVGDGVIDEVLVPRCIPYPAGY